MFKPTGHALQGCVIALTALSFVQIGYDNGLMGGLGQCPSHDLASNVEI